MVRGRDEREILNVTWKGFRNPEGRDEIRNTQD